MCRLTCPGISKICVIGAFKSSVRKMAYMEGIKELFLFSNESTKGVIIDVSNAVVNQRLAVIFKYNDVCTPPSLECDSIVVMY